MRQLGGIVVSRSTPKLTHGAELPTNHLVIALMACRGDNVTVLSNDLAATAPPRRAALSPLA
jgi:hypothetical protein